MDTKHFKELLENEQAVLEKELKTVGRKNPDRPADWEATEDEDIDPAEDAETANSIEIYENNRGVLEQLETRINEVKVALQKIKDGKYGICEICGEKIEADRLEANPAAKTCKLHMNA